MTFITVVFPFAESIRSRYCGCFRDFAWTIHDHNLKRGVPSTGKSFPVDLPGSSCLVNRPAGHDVLAARCLLTTLLCRAAASPQGPTALATTPRTRCVAHPIEQRFEWGCMGMGAYTSGSFVRLTQCLAGSPPDPRTLLQLCTFTTTSAFYLNVQYFCELPIYSQGAAPDNL